MTYSGVQFIAMTEPRDECPICLQILARMCNKATSCGHVFHKDCLDRWLRPPRSTCPTCRREIVSEGDEGAASGAGSEEESDDPDFDPNMTDSDSSIDSE